VWVQVPFRVQSHLKKDDFFYITLPEGFDKIECLKKTAKCK